MAKSKFMRTVVQVEILHTDDVNVPNMSLSDIAYEIQDGDCSGEFKVVSSHKVSAKKMAQLTQAQGSDPSFFGIDENGKEIE